MTKRREDRGTNGNEPGPAHVELDASKTETRLRVLGASGTRLLEAKVATEPDAVMDTDVANVGQRLQWSGHPFAAGEPKVACEGRQQLESDVATAHFDKSQISSVAVQSGRRDGSSYLAG